MRHSLPEKGRCCASLDGVFAFAMVDRHFLYLGRDPLGVRPLFYGFTASRGMQSGGFPENPIEIPGIVDH